MQIRSYYLGMRQDKQELLNRILATGKYRVDTINGKLYSIKKSGVKLLKPGILPSKYQQHTMFANRKSGDKGIFYLHQIIYFAHHGFYDPCCVIDHIDRNKLNCRIDNLRLVTFQENIVIDRQSYAKVRGIRGKEIADIRAKLADGLSQSRIAKDLNLNRLSVRYIVKQIEAGATLKYENHQR